jgi:hypothetical protein
MKRIKFPPGIPVIVGALLATLVVITAAMLLVDIVPHHSMTYGAMHMCKLRVLRYAQQHGSLPASLNDTKSIEGFDSSITDAWDVVFEYSVDTNDVVTFRSLGKDKILGGTGDNADMIGVFPARRSDGKWSDEFVDWTTDPFKGLRK